ncbi:MAG: hypothetical protein ACLFTJ_14035 [Halothece sp.]
MIESLSAIVCFGEESAIAFLVENDKTNREEMTGLTSLGIRSPSTSFALPRTAPHRRATVSVATNPKFKSTVA